MMRDLNRSATIGGIVLALTLSGFLVYQLVLYPGAGFPTDDFGVIVAGANTLRVGHILKFGYAVGLALILVGLGARVLEASALLGQLANISGIAAFTLFVASGMMGLRILQVAQDTFATNPSEAIATILLRSVTIALFEAGIFASGVFALTLSLGFVRGRIVPSVLAYSGIVLGILFILDRVLFFPFNLISPVLAILWALGLAYVLRR